MFSKEELRLLAEYAGDVGDCLIKIAEHVDKTEKSIQRASEDLQRLNLKLRFLTSIYVMHDTATIEPVPPKALPGPDGAE